MGLKGSLAELQLADLVELMSLGRKTGLLTLYDGCGALAGELAFSEGLLVAAACGRLADEKAFYALLDLNEGSFFVDSDVVPAGGRGLPAQSLLMEGARRLDEVHRLRLRLPPGARLSLARPGAAQDAVEAQIVAFLSVSTDLVGDLVARIITSGRADEYECLLTIDRLQTRGLIAISTPPTLASS